MCSYGSFAKMGGSGAGLLRSKGEQRKDRPRRLSTKEKRLGVSLRKADVAFVNACKGGLVDSVSDILAHQAGDERHVTSVNVVVRSGGRSQTNRLTTALPEAARGGHGNVEAFDSFVANGTNLAPTNEMCNVDEGDIRNKGNRLRNKCF